MGQAGRTDRRPGGRREWKKLLASYEDPGIDDAVDAELQEFMARRKAVLDA